MKKRVEQLYAPKLSERTLSQDEIRILIYRLFKTETIGSQINDILLVRLKDIEFQDLLKTSPGDIVCIMNVQHPVINSSLSEFQNGSLQYCVKIQTHGQNNGEGIVREPNFSLDSAIISLKLISCEFNLDPREKLNLGRFGENIKLIPNISTPPINFLMAKYKQSARYSEDEICNLGLYVRFFEVEEIKYPKLDKGII